MNESLTFPVYEPSEARFNQRVTQRNKLFGTDGVRGIANVEPVTAETALKLGRAAAHVFTQLNPRTLPEGTRPKIVLGKDTRLSGYMLENALVAGITSLGVDVLVIGPLPTPGVAYITRSLRADAGIVLSASHNPYEDNGIKFFRHDGYKLDDQIEEQIESWFLPARSIRFVRRRETSDAPRRIDDALGRYVEFAKASFPRGMSLEKMRIAVDVANGAAYKSTPVHFARARRRSRHRPQRTERNQHQRELRQHASGRNPAHRQGERRGRWHHARWRR